MSTNESLLSFGNTKSDPLDQVFGLMAILGAPMLLVLFLFGSPQLNGEATKDTGWIAFWGVFYIGGWIAGIIGIFRRAFYGHAVGGKIVFVIQMILLSLALIYSVLETIGYERSPIVLTVTDAGYPLSHLFMTVTGIFVLKARVWQGVSRFAPFLVGIALPFSFAIMALVGVKAGALIFASITAAGIATIGYTVFKSSK